MANAFTFFQERDMTDPANAKLKELEAIVPQNDNDRILKEALVIALEGQLEIIKILGKLKRENDDFEREISRPTGPS